MIRTSARAFAVAAVPCVIAVLALAAGGADDEASAVFGVKMPAGYRDWPVVSVAREEGIPTDIRAILGNDIAMKAFREGTRPFPDGTIIARLAWQYLPSAQNNAIFGRVQSFVAGPATNVQFSIKDSSKYASTGGWGYGQFDDGKPNRDQALLNGCFPCHNRLPGTADFVFTHYAP